MAKKNIIKIDENLSESDIERLELLQKANQKTGRQLTISAETGSLEEINELRELVGKDFENPDDKYQVYYTGIRKLLMDNLPKGQEFKIVRDIIYDEKNIFLNLGKIKSENNGVRRSDGRMTYQPVMNEMLEVILKWITESLNPFRLYLDLYNLNEKKGYGHEQYDKSTRSIAKALLELAKDESK